MQTEQKAHLLVVGSLNMDLVIWAPRHPDPGETIIGRDFRTYSGGKGANQAVAIARLGAPVMMVGKVGQDNYGDALLTSTAQAGVDTRFILRDSQAHTGLALITINDLGENTIVVASGANASLSAQDVLSAEAAFQGAKILVLQLELPIDAIQQAILLAKKYHAKIILNPAPARELDASFLASIDYLVPNQTELALLTGVAAPASAAALLKNIGVKHLVVTLGSEGALLAEHSRLIHIPPHQIDVVDTTAAGDAFVGAFSVALFEGKDTMQAVTWGNAAGALATTRMGAYPSLPVREELEALLKSRS